jgi:hypothetical protein
MTTLSSCRNDEECMEMNSEYRCRVEKDVEQQTTGNLSLCKHKSLFEDFNFRDISQLTTIFNCFFLITFIRFLHTISNRCQGTTVIIFASACFAAGAGHTIFTLNIYIIHQ